MPARTSCAPACGNRFPAPPCGSCARRDVRCPSTGPPAARGPSSPPSATPRCRPRSPSSRFAATAWTPPSCSPTSSCPCTPSASVSTWSRAGVRWWPSRSAARPTWPACDRSSRRVDAPYVAETVGLVRRELAGSGVALIGFAGAPFTVASYAVEGGPSRTFAKVKALMHGDPELWHQLTERLAAMAVASLRAQIRGRRAGGAALRQLGRLARARRVRPLRPPRHPCRAGRHRRPRRADDPVRRRHRRAPRR